MFRFLALSISVLLTLPTLASAQGVRMSPDFLPLDVGNRWEYEIVDTEGLTLDTFEMEISTYTIVDGTSYYVFSRFPFVGAGEAVGVRYDRDLRQYLRFDGELEGDLFPVSRVSVEVIETDANDLPLKARFDFGDIVLVLERSVGIVEGEFNGEAGTQNVKLVGALIGNEAVVGEVDVRTPQTLLPTAAPTDNVGEVSDSSLTTQIDVVAEADEHQFLFRVQNISDRLLAFDFNSSQNFDFVVIDPRQGDEVWRWSERLFFSEVVRSEGLQAGSEWRFEAAWNHRDKELNEVIPGVYEVVATLVAESPVESEPIQIEVK
jgi:hypothetical protein